MSDSLERRWLGQGSGAIVRAVAVAAGPEVSVLLAFGRHVAGVPSTGLTFLGEREGVLFFIGRHLPDEARHEEELPGVISALAAARSLRVESIGSAVVEQWDDDLRAPSDRAARAAHIARALPALKGVADISELRAWALVDSLVGDHVVERVATFSPAALRLYEAGSESARETVEAYLDACGRVREACEALHIHRTTLYYRLENLPVDVREALDDGMSRSALHLGLKMLRYRDPRPC